jgi:UDP-N-acetyl-D-glucosamine dehydrogenase
MLNAPGSSAFAKDSTPFMTVHDLIVDTTTSSPPAARSGGHGRGESGNTDRHGGPITLSDSDRPDRRRGAHLAELARRLDARTATVAVVGLGYVGLPLLLAAARAGYPVIGVDADAVKIDALANGRSYITDVSSGDLGSLDAATLSVDPGVLEHADVVLLAVPTPLRDGTPDLGPVQQATDTLARVLYPGTLVVLESTTWPGTTEEVLCPALEASGLQAGVDFALAYSPERVDPGSSHAFTATPKLVAGMTDGCTRLAAQFYSTLVTTVVVTKSPREAEMAKLIENTFRQVNIALINELATIAPALGVDIWAALDAAATKPYGYMPFYPGPGVGGHCIAVDPSYLSWKTEQQLGYGVGFIAHALSVNNRMPGHVADRVGQVLNAASLPVNGSRVHLLGLAYKPGVNDARQSPGVAVAECLLGSGALISYTDSHLPVTTIGGKQFTSVSLDEPLLDHVDVTVVLTAHPDVDYSMVLRRSERTFDATGHLRGHHQAIRDGRLRLL